MYVCECINAMDPEDGAALFDSQAALKVFDEYRDRIHKCVEIDIFTAKCEQYGVLECTPITGASVYLPDDIKKTLVLPAIRDSIALNGTRPFLKMLKVMESMSHSRQLAIELQGTRKVIICMCKSIHIVNGNVCRGKLSYLPQIVMAVLCQLAIRKYKQCECNIAKLFCQ